MKEPIKLSARSIRAFHYRYRLNKTEYSSIRGYEGTKDVTKFKLQYPEAYIKMTDMCIAYDEAKEAKRKARSVAFIESEMARLKKIKWSHEAGRRG